MAVSMCNGATLKIEHPEPLPDKLKGSHETAPKTPAKTNPTNPLVITKEMVDRDGPIRVPGMG